MLAVVTYRGNGHIPVQPVSLVLVQYFIDGLRQSAFEARVQVRRSAIVQVGQDVEVSVDPDDGRGGSQHDKCVLYTHDALAALSRITSKSRAFIHRFGCPLILNDNCHHRHHRGRYNISPSSEVPE